MILQMFLFFGQTLDSKFSFSEGPINGVSNVTVLRFLNEWVDRSSNQVLALRSTLSWGIDAFGATNNNGNIADGRFFAWLGQFQWVRRLWDTDNQVLIRTDVQLTPDPLLPLEKFAIGGANSVRGYRENQLVRDNGAVASIEFRFPVFTLPIPGISRGPADGRVQFATFYDFGWSKNENGASPDPRTISSAGIGLRWDPHQKIHAQVYWGIPFRNVDEGGEHSLQDSGIHFLLNMQLF